MAADITGQLKTTYSSEHVPALGQMGSLSQLKQSIALTAVLDLGGLTLWTFRSQP